MTAGLVRPAPLADDDPVARWLIERALRGPVSDAIRRRQRGVELCCRSAIYAMDAPLPLRKRAWALTKAAFFEGFCPIHQAHLDVRRFQGRRRAFCDACGLWWGKPAEETAS